MLATDEKKKVLKYIRELLQARFTHGPEPELDLPEVWLKQKLGIFVTLKKKRNLRGCIGQILGLKPLGESIRHMAFAAAFEDPRFPPLSLEELKDTEIHVSLLTPPKPVSSYKEIRLGTDGIIVSAGWKKGVYLPEVATETGWDPRTFFMSCALEKAGLDNEELERAKLEVFQTESFGENER